MRTVLPTRRLPLRHGFVCLKINRGREVLVLVIHVEAAALRIDCITFGSPFKCQFFFLTQSLAIQNTDRVVARSGNPAFFCRRYIDAAARLRLNLPTAFPPHCPSLPPP